MENYYIILFSISVFLQKDIKAFTLSLLCLLISCCSNTLHDYFTSIDFSFFQAGACVELVSLTLVSAFLFIHKNYKIVWLIYISFLYNLACYVSEGTINTFLVSYYTKVNIVIFELMVVLCFIDSRLKDWLNHLLVVIKLRQINKDIKRLNDSRVVV